MKKILVACGAGVATSTVALNKLKEAFESKGLLNKVQFGQCSIAELSLNADQYDLIIATSTVNQNDYNTPIIFGLPLITGMGIDSVIDEIINVLGLNDD